MNGHITPARRDASDFKNYTTFLEWMGYPKEELGKIYGLVRNGLVHQYFIKGESCVHLREPSDRGIKISGDNVDFYVVQYFSEFCTAYDQYKSKILSGGHNLLDNFIQATSQPTLPTESRMGETYARTTTSVTSGA